VTYDALHRSGAQRVANAVCMGGSARAVIGSAQAARTVVALIGARGREVEVARKRGGGHAARRVALGVEDTCFDSGRHRWLRACADRRRRGRRRDAIAVARVYDAAIVEQAVVTVLAPLGGGRELERLAVVALVVGDLRDARDRVLWWRDATTVGAARRRRARCGRRRRWRGTSACALLERAAMVVAHSVGLAEGARAGRDGLGRRTTRVALCERRRAHTRCRQ
jgi:hypothetical protein